MLLYLFPLQFQLLLLLLLMVMMMMMRSMNEPSCCMWCALEDRMKAYWRDFMEVASGGEMEPVRENARNEGADE